MKNLLKGISLLLLVLVSANLSAQKPENFLGIITYKMTVEGDLSEAEKAQSEGTMEITYGDGVMKKVIQTMMGTVTTIEYADSALMMQDAMGQTFAFRMTKAEMEKMQAKMKSADTTKAEPKVELIDETKVIAGMKCKKAEIEVGEMLIELYYYPEFTVQESMQEDEFKEIKGVPMEYLIPQGEDAGTVHFVATEVKKKKKMKDKDFQLPADVKIMTMEQLKSMMGQ